MLNVAILGSGNIGCDILCKVQRSAQLDCVLFAGRNEQSSGLAFAAARQVPVSAGGLEALMQRLDDVDLVFDATSADAHLELAEALRPHGTPIINLTPAHLGELCVPLLNGDDLHRAANINMITCGGQASLPIVMAVCAVVPSVRYIEVVSAISARSAGPATRRNLDHYITTTEAAIRHFSGCEQVKTILNINPAKPEVSMQTAVSVLFDSLGNRTLGDLLDRVHQTVQEVREYVPGYELIVEPRLDADRLFVMVRVVGRGDYLPPYAGNLDIITSAAVNMAERLAARGVGRATPNALRDLVLR
ncbi:acetaldehyde dehydrogenase (acetylating) [Roseateles amylovorans]|uniref:Acetaldehyde dehydrogenase n=1 Tax=Roseateles amylovorans TaxID=2978473 RepID=A0ABY6AWB8_9BURK|nr:acetaldehyde dehydrogenase (acetylating) [Roseateles amylovorans]UXH77471.1 acetaldehyde dehydrogenase (acetylating) [Roseateles amylovorans]